MQAWIAQQCESLAQGASIWAWPWILAPFALTSMLLAGCLFLYLSSQERKAYTRMWGDRIGKRSRG